MTDDDSLFSGGFSSPITEIFSNPFQDAGQVSYLLREDGFKFLREDSGFILRES